MANKELKEKFIEALHNRDIYIKDVSTIQFCTRCPFCGDSDDINKGHLYIRCDVSDNYPMVYNCFKCSSNGVITKDVMKQLEIDDESLLSSIGEYNKSSDSVKLMAANNIASFTIFNYEYRRGESMRYKIDYIRNRLKVDIDYETESDLKIIPSLYEFLNYNEIKSLTCKKWMADMFDKNYIGFLSYGKSHILLRDVTGKMQMPWIKYPITQMSSRNIVAYSVASNIDKFANEPIIINLSEGVLDAVSIYMNLGYDMENCINIAVCGKQYTRMLNHLIHNGFIGSNIIINIFSDNDEKFNNKKGNESTRLSYYKKIFHKYLYIFGEINIYYNRIYKDCGVPKDKIVLQRNKLLI